MQKEAERRQANNVDAIKRILNEEIVQVFMTCVTMPGAEPEILGSGIYTSSKAGSSKNSNNRNMSRRN